jgi:predicted phage tail component-like protein
MITFNGYDLETTISDLYINNIKRDILPPRSVNLIDIPSRVGAYFLNVKNNVRTYTVDITIAGRTLEDVRSKRETLAKILNTDGLKPLVFSDESYKTYQAIAVENTELDEVKRIAKGTITFLIPDPIAKGQTITSTSVAAGGTIDITNNSNSKVYPKFTVTFNSDAQFFSVIKDDSFVLVGNPASVEEVTVPAEELILWDRCDDLTPWSSTGIQFDYPNAVNAGEMAVVADPIDDNYKFKATSWGDDATYATNWHGPALRRSIPETIQDFRIEMTVECFSSSPNTGRIELIFLDASNVQLGKMVLWDKYTAWENNSGIIYAGTINNRVDLLRSLGHPNQGSWNDFHGRLKIKRVGNEWSAVVTKILDSGEYVYETHLFKKKFIENQFTNPIASIQIHLSKYGETDSAAISIRGIRVFKINTVQTTEIPTLFKAGDVLEIDHEKSVVFLNGEFFMQHVDPASKFFALDPGTTSIATYTTDAENTTVSYEFAERWI